MTSHNIPYQNLWGGVGGLTWAALALQVGCGPADRAFPARETGLAISDSQVVLGPTAIGFSDRHRLKLTNGDATAVTVEVALAGAEAADAARLTLDFFDAAEGTLLVEPDGGWWIFELVWHPQSGAAYSDSLLVTDTASGDLLFELPIQATVDPDHDNDGAAHVLAGGDDCHDGNAAIGPDMIEIWYDGIDQDCDGNDDDADGDGVGVEDDCDDQDDERYPGNEEVWYDGVDQDCDGNDDDADGDGFAGNDDDCDDGDPLTFPGAEDLADGIDQDCDGVFDEDGLSEGDAVFTELFPSIRSKTGTYSDFFELYINVGASVEGWELVTTRGAGTLSQRSEDLGGWVLLCSAGLAETVEACGAVVEPWPVLSRSEETLTLSAGGLVLDSVSWTADWGLSASGLQLDRNALGTAAANDDLASWCAEDPSPGAENAPCP